MANNGIKNFGKRLAQMRRAKGMTQNELAEKLSITPQAISKWEREEGLPDVTLFPEIASVLGVSVGELFGEKTEKENAVSEYYEGLALVGISGNLLCYSDKKAEHSDDIRVTFSDGSYADFSDNLVINCGPGEIRIIEREKDDVHEYSEIGETVLDKEFTPFSSLEISNNYPCDIEIRPSRDGSYGMHAEGSAKFISLIDSSFTADGVLRVQVKSANGNNGRNTKNLLVIYAGFEKGEGLSCHINGSGSLKTDFTFERGTLHINGSGDISIGDLGEWLSVVINGSGDVNAGNVQTNTVLQINGSGDITCGSFGEMLSAQINGSGDISGARAGTANLRIAGSGDININELTRALGANITGSGDITCGGSIAMLELCITGAGELHGENLTAKEADITLKGTSGAAIGRIIGRSAERIAKTATLNVIKRG